MPGKPTMIGVFAERFIMSTPSDLWLATQICIKAPSCEDLGEDAGFQCRKRQLSIRYIMTAFQRGILKRIRSCRYWHAQGFLRVLNVHFDLVEKSVGMSQQQLIRQASRTHNYNIAFVGHYLYGK